MATDLGDATRIEGADGHYSAMLSDQWEIWGPNGGYLAAICLRAAPLRRHGLPFRGVLVDPLFELWIAAGRHWPR